MTPITQLQTTELKEELEAVQHFISELRTQRSHPATPPLTRNEKDRLKRLYKERKQLKSLIRGKKEVN